MTAPVDVTVTGAQVVAVARSMLGVRWVHQGRSRQGIDCIGLPVLVRRELGLATLDVADYARMATSEAMIAYCRLHMQELSIEQLAPGDLLILRFDPNRHMALVGDYPLGGLSLIHAYSMAPRRVVEHRFDDVWRSRLLGAFRFPEIVAEIAPA